MKNVKWKNWNYAKNETLECFDLWQLKTLTASNKFGRLSKVEAKLDLRIFILFELANTLMLHLGPSSFGEF